MFAFIIYFLIFLVSTIFPIFLFVKSRKIILKYTSKNYLDFILSVISSFLFALISLVLTVVIINIYFISPLPQDKTGEFQEVFWMWPSFVVLIICVIYTIKKQEKGTPESTKAKGKQMGSS